MNLRSKKFAIIGGSIFLFLLFLMIITPDGQQNSTTPQVKTTVTESPKATDIPVQKFNVEVSSMIVKKVDKKYRYFFDIRNKDSKPFQGSVSIKIYKDKSNFALGSETFNTTKPIEPTLGNPVYFDINTGPVSVHGENGIKKYTYSVQVNGKEVNKGEGIISDKLEDLSGL